MVSSGNFRRSSSIRITPRIAGSPRVSAHRKWWASPPGQSFNTLAVIFCLVSSALVVGCVFYLYVYRYLGRGSFVAAFSGSSEFCDVFDGRWVPDDTYPLYNSSECPFAERGFNCLANGRKDMNYLKWRWKPRHCNMPKFDAREVLERLRGKRVVFVGDSMSRTQWESLICMLMTGVEDPKTVYEVNGNTISKTIRFLGVRFKTFNLSIEFFRSVFLVQQGLAPKHAPRRVHMTLQLDKMDDICPKWIDSDVLIFNSGHWWTPSKLFDMGCYFQTEGAVRLGMSINSAFKFALVTWASWVETMINTNRTHVFFRTFEPSHWSGLNQKVCELSEQPLSEAKANDRRVMLILVCGAILLQFLIAAIGAFLESLMPGMSWYSPTFWLRLDNFSKINRHKVVYIFFIFRFHLASVEEGAISKISSLVDEIVDLIHSFN